MPYRLVDGSKHPAVRAFLHSVAGLATGVLLVSVLWLLVATYELSTTVRDTQIDNTQQAEIDRERDRTTRQIAQQVARAAARIEDCTTPDRDCFEESQRRLSRTVAGLNDYALAAAACADQPRQQSVEEIRECIIEVISQVRKP